MRRLLHILDFADSHPTPCAVFSLDAEKAFDRLEWNYMWAVLQCFGFGEHFVSMIKTLYHSPAASVITGNIISPSFPLQRGTRQGCPLSPLLFCLPLEPLAQAIRKSEVSIKIHDHNHSISLFLLLWHSTEAVAFFFSPSSPLFSLLALLSCHVSSIERLSLHCSSN